MPAVFGVDGGLEDGGNAAELLKKSEARRRVLYCFVDGVDVVVVLGMETRLTGGRLFRCEFEDVAVRIVGIQYVD